jgi:hypothetical protein
MSIETPDTRQADEPNTHRRPNRLRNAVAATALSAAFIGVGVEISQPDGGHEPQSQSDSVHHWKNPTNNPSNKPVTPTPGASSTPTPETTLIAMPHGQKAVESLPGFGMRVTEQERAMLRASTVKIVDRPKGVDGAAWFDVCSGLKVSVGGADYAVTSSHCFDKESGVKKEFPSHANGADPSTAPNRPQTQNITDMLSHDFGVWTVGSDGMEVQDAGKTAPVSAVSISGDRDFALLKIDESAPESAAFDALPAAPYEAGLSKAPIPGAEAAVFSLPDSNGGQIVAGKGYYLGRIKDPGDAAKEIDLVGIDPDTPADDACNFGASGSVAVIGGGYMTGPLSIRNNISNPPGSNGGDGTSNDINNRQAMADELNLDLSKFPTVCGYSVIPPATAIYVTRGIS